MPVAVDRHRNYRSSHQLFGFADGLANHMIYKQRHILIQEDTWMEILQMSNQFFPRIQYELSDRPSVHIVETVNANFIYQCRQRPGPCQNHPKIANNPHSHFHPRFTSLPWFEFDSTLAKQAFREINHEVFEGNDDGLEKEEIEPAGNRSPREHNVAREVNKARGEEGDVELGVG